MSGIGANDGSVGFAMGGREAARGALGGGGREDAVRDGIIIVISSSGSARGSSGRGGRMDRGGATDRVARSVSVFLGEPVEPLRR